MADQKNPPRTRKAQINDAYVNDGETQLFQEFEIFDFEEQLHEAEARGRAEALAELRAGAEPVAWTNPDHLEFNGFGFSVVELREAEEDSYSQPLYTHPPVPREAELADALKRIADSAPFCGSQSLRRIACTALAASPETRG